MQRLKEEIKRQIDTNQTFIDNNFMYDYEEVGNVISNLFLNEKLDIDAFNKLMTVDYLKSNLNEIKKLYSESACLERIKNLLKSGISEINIEDYKKCIEESSSLNADSLTFIKGLNIDVDDIETYKMFYVDDESGLNNGWIDEYIEIGIKAIVKKQNRIVSEIKELIRSLENTLSRYRYPNYNTANNLGGRSVATDVSISIEVCKEKVKHLKKILKDCFNGDIIKACHGHDEYVRLITFVIESQLDDSVKQIIMIRLKNINLEYIRNLQSRTNNAIISEIDRNASRVNAEIEEHIANEQDSSQDNIENEEASIITFDDIISIDGITNLNFSDEELEKFNKIRSLIEEYLAKNEIKSSVFADEDTLIELQFVDDGDSRIDYMIQDNKVLWNFVIVDLHKNRESKDIVLEIVDTALDRIKNNEIIEKQNKTLGERYDSLDEILDCIDEYLEELYRIYKPEKEAEKNEVISDLVNFRERINNISNDEILNDTEYNKIINLYMAFEDRVSDFKNDEITNEVEDMPENIEKEVSELQNLDEPFDINNNNYIVFDPKFKRQLKKEREGFYLAQVVNSIAKLRNKDRNGSKRLKSLTAAAKDGDETKERKIRVFYARSNNNTYYVSGMMVKQGDGRPLDNAKISRYTKTADQKAKELQRELDLLTQVQGHDMCEASYQEIIEILKSKFKKGKSKEIGGATEDAN